MNQVINQGPLELLAEFAPIAGDEARGKWIESRLKRMGLETTSPNGLSEARRDSLGNIFVGNGRLLLVSHMDTVLTPGTLYRGQNRWQGPAVGDNSAGIAVLLSLAPKLSALGASLAFSVGEEGFGNLKGARALVKNLRPGIFVAVDGYLPGVVHHAVGSQRLRASFRGPGGHAWGERHQPSPAPALGETLARLYALQRPQETSLNVGRVWGGEAINAIPPELGLELDFRAMEAGVLSDLGEKARAIMMEAAQRHKVELSLENLGERPAGSTFTPAMRQAALEALTSIGENPDFTAGSTDASAAVEAGIPAMGFGVYKGGGAHTPQEWVDPSSLESGASALLRLTRLLLNA